MRMMATFENKTKADREARKQQEDHRRNDQREMLAELRNGVRADTPDGVATQTPHILIPVMKEGDAVEHFIEFGNHIDLGPDSTGILEGLPCLSGPV